MTIQSVGAGLGRADTMSLKLALEHLAHTNTREQFRERAGFDQPT
jgi:hypothetical protein